MSDNIYMARAKESYGEVAAELSRRYAPGNSDGHIQSILAYTQKHPVRSAILGTASALAIGASVFAWGPVVTVAQGAALAGFFIAREAATFKEHRHINALASISCAATAGQQWLMAATSGEPGAYIPGGVMLSHAAATLAAFAIIPEAKKAFRAAVTWGGGVAGALGAAYASYKFENGTGIIPAVTTLANSVVFSIKDGSTPRARAAYIGMNLGHLFYWATQPVASLSLMATEAMYVLTHGNTLAEHDVPIADRETGSRYSFLKQTGLYFRDVLVQGKRAEELGITRSENGWERADDRFYRTMRGLVLGK